MQSSAQKTRYFVLLSVMCLPMLFLSACGESAAPPPYVIASSWLAAGLDTTGWPTFGYDATHSGTYPSQAQRSALRGHVAWQHDVGGSIFSAPVLANGVVYVGSTGGNLLALDAATGTVRWKHSIGQFLNDTTPVVVGRVVFVAANRTQVYALDTTNGKLLWSMDAHDIIKAAPTYASGLLLLNAGATTFALDARTGNVRWRFHEAGSGWPTQAAPTVLGDTVYVAQGTKPILYALALANGRQLWSYNASERLIATPVIVGQNVVVSTWNGHLLALNTTTGVLRWSYDVNRALPQGMPTDGIAGSPAATKDTVFIGTYNGNVVALNAQSGQLRWAHLIDAPILGVPAVTSDTLYISGGQKMYALLTKNGAASWHLGLGDVRSDVALGMHQLYVGTVEGSLYAVE